MSRETELGENKRVCLSVDCRPCASMRNVVPFGLTLTGDGGTWVRTGDRTTVSYWVRRVVQVDWRRRLGWRPMTGHSSMQDTGGVIDINNYSMASWVQVVTVGDRSRYRSRDVETGEGQRKGDDGIYESDKWV